ncbi:hypothetical protein M9Y10_020827 [Tritrichomonas musculus]|uniref:Glycosyl hydrolase family 13 catalytic domain-containing protein n=1 Tax=Tritrichomonas musculus TaxID=1915356 RepID=A0ABR2HEN6_9EUKA
MTTTAKAAKDTKDIKEEAPKKELPPPKNDFERRLRQHYDELKWLYYELYQNNEKAFNYFVSMLERMWEGRKEALREQDKAREANPHWYKRSNVLGMMLYVNAFAGNLQGLIKKLPYLQESGINYLHLMPLLESPKGRSDGGYAVSDFRKIQPELGTIEDLEELADACRKEDIAVCLDFVLNHTSEDHEWAKKARANEPGYRDRYFFYDNWNIPNEYEKTVPQVFPTTAPGSFTWLDDCKQIVMTNFYPYQWDLNYGNFIVFNDMTENLLYLANRGMDVIRLDATPYIWKQIGTKCRNLPQVHTLIRMLRMACEIVCPSVLLLGEVVMEPVKVVPYFGTTEKPECHMLYNVTTMATTWHTLATGDVSLLRHQMEAVCSLPKCFTFLNYLRCHDDIGWGLDYDFLGAKYSQKEVPHKRFLNDYFLGRYYGSPSRGELYNDDPRLGDARLCGTTASLVGVEVGERDHNEELLKKAVQCDLTLHAWILSQSGIPVIYSGDEVAQLNDYTYHDDPEKADDSRYLHRGNFNWELAEKRKDPTTVQGQIFQGLRKIEKLRNSEPCFDHHADTWVEDSTNGHVLAFVRKLKDRELVCLYNFDGEFAHAGVKRPPGKWTEIVHNIEHDQIYDVELYPYGFAWLVRDYSKDEK